MEDSGEDESGVPGRKSVAVIEKSFVVVGRNGETWKIGNTDDMSTAAKV